MQLKVVGSGSSGNLYILETENEALVIEAGVHLKELKKAMNFNISKIEAVFALHSHLDHSKYVESYMKNGIKVYGSVDVHEKHGCCLIKDRETINIGGFTIKPLSVKHDVENFCLLINHKECGNTLYASDLHYLPYKLKNLNNILIEANYDIELLDRNVSSGRVVHMLRERIIESHMELQTVKGVMKANDLSKVNNIVLLHLSDSNSHAERFKKEIGQLTGKRVTIAEAGLVMDFNKEF